MFLGNDMSHCQLIHLFSSSFTVQFGYCEFFQEQYDHKKTARGFPWLCKYKNVNRNPLETSLENADRFGMPYLIFVYFSLHSSGVLISLISGRKRLLVLDRGRL